MGGLLGPVGGLEELRCASSLSEAPASSDVMSITPVGTGREYAQLTSAPTARAWDVEAGTARPQEMHPLRQLSRWQRRNRSTLVYYSEAAQVENMLEPGASLMALADPDDEAPQPQTWTGMSPGGSRILPDGHLPGPRFLDSGATAIDGRWAHLSNIPVPSGRQVTASIYLTAYAGHTAHFWVDELDLMGQTIQPVRKATTTGVLQRLAFTFTTQPHTVALTLGVSRAATAVAPQLTLTSGPIDWVEGQGCTSALLMAAPSRQVQLAIPEVSWGSRSAYSWQIRELSRGTDY